GPELPPPVVAAVPLAGRAHPPAVCVLPPSDQQYAGPYGRPTSKEGPRGADQRTDQGNPRRCHSRSRRTVDRAGRRLRDPAGVDHGGARRRGRIRVGVRGAATTVAAET